MQYTGSPTAFDFYPRSPCGERLLGNVVAGLRTSFLSTLSLRRATPEMVPSVCTSINFYPRSPCGERQLQRFFARYLLQFLSTLSLRRATTIFAVRPYDAPMQFLSTLSLRRATGILALKQIPLTDFYPRSPCGERRTDTTSTKMRQSISIHALLAESDPMTLVLACAIIAFLSTLSLRRATSP